LTFVVTRYRMNAASSGGREEYNNKTDMTIINKTVKKTM